MNTRRERSQRQEPPASVNQPDIAVEQTTSCLFSAIRPTSSPLREGNGLFFTDDTGRRFLDLSSQTLNLMWGHDAKVITDALITEISAGVHFASSRFGSVPFLKLSRALVEIAPRPLSAVNIKMCDGSDAVETAVKLARKHTRRTKLVVLKGAWHGETIATLSMSSRHRGLYGITTVGEDVVFSREATLLSLVEAAQEHRDAAAVLIDPVGVAVGLFSNDDIQAGLGQLRHVCNQTGAMLIFDEVQSYGYLGPTDLLAAKVFTVTPDIIALGKALGSGWPIAGVLCHENLKSVLLYNEAEFTNGGQPPAAVAALKGIKLFYNSRDKITKNLEGFQTFGRLGVLSQLDFRSVGFFASVGLRGSKYRELWVDRVYDMAFQDGIVLRKTDAGRRILLKPSPLIETETSIDAADRLTDIMQLVCKEIQTTPRRRINQPPPARGCLDMVTKPVGLHRNHDYVEQLLHNLGMEVRIGYRQATEQEVLCQDLRDLGIPVVPVFKVSASELEFAYMPGDSLAMRLNIISEDNFAEANGLIINHQQFIERAHDAGILIGDRWPGNALVDDRGNVYLIDFEITYAGLDLEALMAFEETWALFQCLAHLRITKHTRDLALRLGPALLRRHATTAEKVWESIKRFYSDYRKPENATSRDVISYRRTANILDAAMVSCRTETRRIAQANR